MTDMIEETQRFLSDNNIKNKCVLMALSGGVDSSVLFFILNKLKSEFNLNLKAIHLNHNWRGRESIEDLKFCETIAKKNECEFFSKTLDDSIKKTEASAREARYAFFEEALIRFNSDICFLAHNKNDNVETLLYRIAKGTGPSGLSSIPKIRKPYYRPILDVSRTEIENFASLHRIKFCTDKSNNDTKYKRNFIRKNIIPNFETINNNAVNAINSLIKLSSEQNELVNDYILDIEKEIFDNAEPCSAGLFDASFNPLKEKKPIKRKDFLFLKDSIQREILSRYFKGILKNRDYKTILKIQNFIKENENSLLSLNSDSFLKIQNDKVYIHKPSINKASDIEIPILSPGEYKILDYIISIKKVSFTKAPLKRHKKNGEEYVNLNEPLDYVLRFRKDGDIFSPLGTVQNSLDDKQKKQPKLKDYFINKKIPQNLRSKIPLLCHKNEVFWVTGVQISDKIKLDFQNKTQDKTKNTYKLSITRKDKEDG